MTLSDVSSRYVRLTFLLFDAGAINSYLYHLPVFGLPQYHRIDKMLFDTRVVLGVVISNASVLFVLLGLCVVSCFYFRPFR